MMNPHTTKGNFIRRVVGIKRMDILRPEELIKDLLFPHRTVKMLQFTLDTVIIYIIFTSTEKKVSMVKVKCRKN